MIRIPGDSELEVRLVQTISERLRERRKRLENFAKQLERSLKEVQGLSPTDRLKFKVLDRQFGGQIVPGLPSVVAAGRFLLRSFRRLRGS